MSFLKKLKVRKKGILDGDNLRLHLGCGKDHIEGMINCDIQKLKGVDLVMNCGDLSDVHCKSVSLIFTHSFFEHLYVYQHSPFFEGCKRVLNKEGALVLLGIPDFDKIAQLYHERAEGVHPFGGTFDLYQAYRLTHGDFEENGKANIPQLHKTIFDKNGLTRLLEKHSFSDYSIFNYKAPKEQYKLAIGIVAWKKRSTGKESARRVLSGFKKYFGDFENDVEKGF